MKKIKKNIETEFWRDERGFWRWACNDLKVGAGYCSLKLAMQLDAEYPTEAKADARQKVKLCGDATDRAGERREERMENNE